MKKLLVIGSAVAYLAAVSAANAQLIIQPTIVETPPPAYVAAPVYTAPVVAYPVHRDHHHPYDWQYWHDHHDHDHR